MLASVVHQALRRAVHRSRRINLVLVREEFQHAQVAVPVVPEPPPLAKKLLAKAPKPRVVEPVLEEKPSAWDPEPIATPVTFTLTAYQEELRVQEINGCKTLLLEIIRRTAYDWVLYRTSTRLLQKVLADQAYQWLFVEMPGTADWAERMKEKKYITSFIAICEGLDLDPDTVRNHIRRLTPKHVMSVGRPAEYRRRDVFTTKEQDAEVYSLPGGMVEQVESEIGDGDVGGGGGEEF